MVGMINCGLNGFMLSLEVSVAELGVSSIGVGMELSLEVGIGGIELSLGVGIGGIELPLEIEIGGMELSFGALMGRISGMELSFEDNGAGIIWVLTTLETEDCSNSFKPGRTSKVKMIKKGTRSNNEVDRVFVFNDADGGNDDNDVLNVVPTAFVGRAVLEVDLGLAEVDLGLAVVDLGVIVTVNLGVIDTADLGAIKLDLGAIELDLGAIELDLGAIVTADFEVLSLPF